LKYGLGNFGIGTLIGHSLDPSNLPGDGPLGVVDILLKLNEFWGT
jgi:hypothetical protein